ncbi:MAG: ABC transporter ATP-binding protein, partial [Chloroflexota bacterium]
VDPDILLVDEVLSVGDAGFSQKSRERMEEFKNRGKTIVLATHDLNTVETWCQQALLLYGGQVCALGEPKAVVAKYQEMVLAGTLH